HKRAIEAKASSIKADYENNDIQAIEEQLKDVTDHYPGFVNLYVGNRAGESITFYPKVFQDNEKWEYIDFSDRDYYKELVDSKETDFYESFPGRGETAQLLVTISSPLLDQQYNFGGYLLGASDLTGLEEPIDSRNLGKEGYAFILAPMTNVIAHPTI